MALMLDSHPDVRVYGEQHGAYDFKKEWSDDTIPVAGFQVPGWAELFVEYDCVRELLEDKWPLIFMLRDVRDVVSSMRNLGRDHVSHNRKSQREWLDDPARSLRKKYGEELLSSKSPEVWLAVYWKYKTDFYFDMLDQGYKVLGVSYEALTTEPRKEIEKIAQFLELPWHNNLLNHHQLEHEFIVKDGGVMGNTDQHRPIDTASIGHRALLTDKQLAEVMASAGELNQRVKEACG